MEGRRDRKMGIRSGGGGGIIAFFPRPLRPSPPFATHGPGDLRACGEGGREEEAGAEVDRWLPPDGPD